MPTNPTTKRPDNLIELSDGTSTIGLILCDGQGNPITQGPWPFRQSGTPRTALQTSVGDADYSSYKLPYTPVTERDFSKGIGAEDFEEDKARFLDSHFLDTIHGDITMASGASGVSITDIVGIEQGVLGSNTPPGSRPPGHSTYSNWVATKTTTIRQVTVWAAWAGDDSGAIIIRADAAGAPGGVLHTAAMPRRTGLGTGTPIEITLPIEQNVNLGTTYWIGFILNNTNYYLQASALAGKSIYGGSGAPGLLYSNTTIAMRLSEISGDSIPIFVDYRGSLITILNNETGGAPLLLLNGVHGFAKDNTSQLDRLLTDQNMTALSSSTCLVGSWVRIVSGPGFGEFQPWRKIIGHTKAASGNYILVDRPWGVVHTTLTEFAVIGSLEFQEITGHGSTKPITSALVYGDIMYLARGEGYAVMSGKFTGTWAWYSEPTVKATYMIYNPDREGLEKLWFAAASTSNVYNAPATTTFGAPGLTTGAAIPCGNKTSRITNMISYGSPSIPWILKEDAVGYIDYGIFQEIQNREFRTVRSELNGRAACSYGVYLFFSLLNGGVERYFQERLDDLGPNLEKGMPQGERGAVVSMVPYPGGIWAAVDAGAKGTSSILYYNQFGWHKFHTASGVDVGITSSINSEGESFTERHQLPRAAVGERIRGVTVQATPDPNVADFVWFLEGNNIGMIRTSLRPLDEDRFDYMPAIDGDLTTAWISTNFREINKFIKSMRIFADGLGNDSYVRVTYQIDNELAAWQACVSDFTVSPVQEVLLSATYNRTCKRIRFKFDVHRSAGERMPRIKAIAIETITRLPTTRGFSASFLVADGSTNLQGKTNRPAAGQAWPTSQVLDKLREWANSDQRAAPITMRSSESPFDSLYVFIDPPSLTVASSGGGEGSARRNPRYIVNLAIQEV